MSRIIHTLSKNLGNSEEKICIFPSLFSKNMYFIVTPGVQITKKWFWGLCEKKSKNHFSDIVMDLKNMPVCTILMYLEAPCGSHLAFATAGALPRWEELRGGGVYSKL